MSHTFSVILLKLNVGDTEDMQPWCNLFLPNISILFFFHSSATNDKSGLNLWRCVITHTHTHIYIVIHGERAREQKTQTRACCSLAVQYMVACSTTELNQCTDLSNLWSTDETDVSLQEQCCMFRKIWMVYLTLLWQALYSISMMFKSSEVNETQSTSKYEQWYIICQQHIHSLFVLQTVFAKTHTV